MYYPIDAITVRTLQAVALTTDLIPTRSNPITILNYSLDATAQNSQLLQCLTNGVTYKTLAQKINAGKQYYDVSIVLPANTVCYLKTFDATLTEGVITYVDRDISAQLDTSQVEIATGSASAIHDALTVDWFFQTILLLFAGIWIGLYIFKR
jgi:hypothetical protein